MPDARDRRGGDDERACFHVHLLRIDPVDRAILQQRIGERAVHVEHRRRGVRRIVQQLPRVMREQPAEVRRQDDERDEIERGGAERVRDRLRRRPDGDEDVEQSKSRRR